MLRGAGSVFATPGRRPQATKWNFGRRTIGGTTVVPEQSPYKQMFRDRYTKAQDCRRRDLTARGLLILNDDAVKSEPLAGIRVLTWLVPVH